MGTWWPSAADYASPGLTMPVYMPTAQGQEVQNRPVQTMSIILSLAKALEMLVSATAIPSAAAAPASWQDTAVVMTTAESGTQTSPSTNHLEHARVLEELKKEQAEILQEAAQDFTGQLNALQAMLSTVRAEKADEKEKFAMLLANAEGQHIEVQKAFDDYKLSIQRQQRQQQQREKQAKQNQAIEMKRFKAELSSALDREALEVARADNFEAELAHARNLGTSQHEVQQLSEERNFEEAVPEVTQSQPKKQRVTFLELPAMPLIAMAAGVQESANLAAAAKGVLSIDVLQGHRGEDSKQPALTVGDRLIEKAWWDRASSLHTPSVLIGRTKEEAKAEVEDANTEGKATGRVSKWNDEKGYGFIVQNGTNDSIYVHRTGLRGAATLQEGDEVEYETCQDTRDMERNHDRAINVVVNAPAEAGWATCAGCGKQTWMQTLPPKNDACKWCRSRHGKTSRSKYKAFAG